MSTTPLHSASTSIRQSSRRSIVKGAAGAAASAFIAAGWTVQATARPMVETGSAPAVRTPVKVVVVYDQPDDVELFEGYYRTKHMPLAMKLPNCASLETAIAVSGPEGEAASFYRIATLTFNSEADMVACMNSEVGQAAFADIANFATGGATATILSDIQAVQPGTSNPAYSEVAGPGRFEQRQPE